MFSIVFERDSTDLRISCEAIPDEPLVMLRHVIPGHVERLVEKLEIRHRVDDAGFAELERMFLPPVDNSNGQEDQWLFTVIPQ